MIPVQDWIYVEPSIHALKVPEQHRRLKEKRRKEERERICRQFEVESVRSTEINHQRRYRKKIRGKKGMPSLKKCVRSIYDAFEHQTHVISHSEKKPNRWRKLIESMLYNDAAHWKHDCLQYVLQLDIYLANRNEDTRTDQQSIRRDNYYSYTTRQQGRRIATKVIALTMSCACSSQESLQGSSTLVLPKWHVSIAYLWSSWGYWAEGFFCKHFSRNSLCLVIL